MPKLIRNVLLCLIMLSISAKGICESIEVLKGRLVDASTDSAKVKVLARLGFEYAFVNLDSSRQYSEKAIALAKKIGFVRGHADALNNMAISYGVSGQYERAIEFYMEARELYQNINFKPGMARIYNNCGMVYESLGDLEKAMDCHIKSMEIEQELGDSLGVAYSQIHIANINLALNQYQQAFVYYESSRNALEFAGDKEGLAYVYLGIGKLYFETSQNSQALSQISISLKMFQELNNKNGASEALFFRGKTYLAMNDYSKAKEGLLTALEQSKELGMTSLSMECMITLVKLHKKLGQFQQALAIHEEYKALQDSTRIDEMTSNIQEMESRYNFEKKEQEIELLSAEKEFQKYLRNVFIGALIIIILIAALLYRAYRLSMIRANLLRVKNKEIRAKNVVIREEKSNALAAAHAKSEFLSVMSHEIRTPMNAVIGSVHLLLQKNPQPDQMDNLKTLQFSAENLLLLINNILDLNKMESGKVHLEKSSFDLKELCTSIFMAQRPEALKKGIEFKLTYDDDIPHIYFGDAGRLGQILNNLISNGIKFTEKGQVKFEVKLVNESESTASLHFEIRDTGIGIPADKMSLVFESFSQADSNTTRKYGGTGLGLYITRKLLELYGSYVIVESEPDEGSTFYFQLELQKDPKHHQKSERNDKIKISALRDKKILVVDDDKTNLLIAKSVLTRWGLDVTTAEGGNDALNLFSHTIFDLVLLDLRMPDMNGYQVAQAMRAFPETKKNTVPIIALSANSLGQAESESKIQGMDDYLAKPFDPKKLLDMLHSHLVENIGGTQNDY